MDYIQELNEGKALTEPVMISDEGVGKDRDDKPEYRVKAQLAFAFNNEFNLIEYYHNSSYLEHGGSPDKAVKQAFVYEIEQFNKSKISTLRTRKRSRLQIFKIV